MIIMICWTSTFPFGLSLELVFTPRVDAKTQKQNRLPHCRKFTKNYKEAT